MNGVQSITDPKVHYAMLKVAIIEESLSVSDNVVENLKCLIKLKHNIFPDNTEDTIHKYKKKEANAYLQKM
jgi:hypothetical protein